MLQRKQRPSGHLFLSAETAKSKLLGGLCNPHFPSKAPLQGTTLPTTHQRPPALYFGPPFSPADLMSSCLFCDSPPPPAGEQIPAPASSLPPSSPSRSLPGKQDRHKLSLHQFSFRGSRHSLRIKSKRLSTPPVSHLCVSSSPRSSSFFTF